MIQEFGDPEVLRWEEAPTPAPGPGEVLVRVHAVSVNRTVDLQVRQDGGNYGVVLPLVLGTDLSGVVVAVGPSVEQPRVHDRVAVFGGIRCGACTQCLAKAMISSSLWVSRSMGALKPCFTLKHINPCHSCV